MFYETEYILSVRKRKIITYNVALNMQYDNYHQAELESAPLKSNGATCETAMK